MEALGGNLGDGRQFFVCRLLEFQSRRLETQSSQGPVVGKHPESLRGEDHTFVVCRDASDGVLSPPTCSYPTSSYCSKPRGCLRCHSQAVRTIS